jgi:hypothetical protein
MTAPNWNLLPSPAAPGEAFREGMAMGERLREKQDEREMRRAVAALAANPDDPAALQEVMARNPELGMKLSEFQDKRAYRGALAEYLSPQNPMLGGRAQGALSTPGRQPAQPALGQPANALAMMSAPPAGQPSPQAAQPNALLAMGQPAPPAPPGQTPPPPQQQSGAPAEGQPDFSFLGRPQSRQDAAFLRMVQHDPLEAIKIQSAMRDNFLDRVKGEREFYSIAVDELSQVTDDAGWQRALQRVAPVAQALGADLSRIPTAYPGPDAVRQLLEQSLPVKERLDYFLRQANMEADNDRADRSADSTIEAREQRLRDQRTADQGRLENQRRGQDLTDQRQRDRPAPARTNRRTGTRNADSALPLVHTPAEARRLAKGTRFRTPDGRVKIAQ